MRRGLLVVFLFLISANNCLADFFDEMKNDEYSGAPTFVTPARMTSSYLDSPNSSTRLEVEDLYFLGIDNVVDALRLVPGMIVTDVHGSNAVVGYHGTSVNIPRRLEILYNSNSVYRPGYSGIHWHRLPFDVPDLSSIEVVRGSNVVDFGSNAFTGTVNFIQNPVALEPEYSGFITTGSGNTQNAWLSSHQSMKGGHYLIRYFHKENDGFDYSNGFEVNNDSSSGDGISFIGELDIDNGIVFDWSLAASNYMYYPSSFDNLSTETSFLNQALDSTSTPRSLEETSISLITKLNGRANIGANIDWSVAANIVQFERKHPIELCLRAFMFDPLLEQLDNSPNIRLVPEDIPLALTSGLETGIVTLDASILSPLSANDTKLLQEIGTKMQDVGLLALIENICGETDQDVEEERAGVSVNILVHDKNNYSFSSNLSLNKLKAKSTTYLNREVTNNTYSWSNNLRYYLRHNLIVNTGFMLEGNDSNSDVYTSHRLSLNFEPISSNIIRITYSESERSPDIYESSRRWNYNVQYEPGVIDYNGNNSATLFRNSVSPDNLQSERIESFEISYIYADKSNTHYFDIKYFLEKLRDLISEPFNYYDFRLTNNGWVDLQGAEVSYRYTAKKLSGLKIGANYTYLENETNTPFEDTLFTPSFGNIWTIYPLKFNTYLGLSVYYYRELAGYDYKRQDVTLSKSFYYHNTAISMRLNYRHYPSTINSYTEVSATTPNIVSNKNRDSFLFTISLEY